MTVRSHELILAASDPHPTFVSYVHHHRWIDSFLAGTVSSFRLFATTHLEWPEGVQWDDAEALRSDWEAVGGDLWSALRTYHSITSGEPQEERLFDPDALHERP